MKISKKELSYEEILDLWYEDAADDYYDDSDDEFRCFGYEDGEQEHAANNPDDPTNWFVLNKDKWYCDGLIH